MKRFSLLLVCVLCLLLTSVLSQSLLGTNGIRPQNIITRYVPVRVPNQEDLKTRRYSYMLLIGVVMANALLSRFSDDGITVSAGEVPSSPGSSGGGGPTPGKK